MMFARRLLVALAAIAVALWLLAPSGTLVLAAQAGRGGVETQVRLAASSSGGGTAGSERVASGSGAARKAVAALPAMPAGWPSDQLDLGLADAPGGATRGVTAVAAAAARRPPGR